MSDLPRHLKLSDEQLREHLAEGWTHQRIADEYGVSRSAITQRITSLRTRTAAAATVAPEESRRFADQALGAWEQISKGRSRVNLLMDACHSWLQDADDPDVYDVGPRADEVTVTYWEPYTDPSGRPARRKKKEKLGFLLRQIEALPNVSEVERGEVKHADIRELILKTVSEARALVEAEAEIARALADQRAMQVLREAMIDALQSISPDLAAAASAAVRRVILLQCAALGPGALPAPAPAGPA